jgi:hypothetical protein
MTTQRATATDQLWDRWPASNWMLLILKAPRVRCHVGEPQDDSASL